jgi:cytochrome c
MHAQNIVLVALLIALSGCQREEAAPVPSQQSKPAAAEITATPAAMEPMASAMMGSAPQAAMASMHAQVAAAPVAAATTGPAAAGTDPLQLAKKNNCFACHTLDKKLVGPAWKDVAAKYRGDATAEAKLVDKVGKGGVGVWGTVPMPPNALASEADRKILVKFILSLK